MRVNFPQNVRLFKLFFTVFTLTILLLQKSNAQTCPGIDPNCDLQEYNPLPKMWVSNGLGKFRFTNFRKLYGPVWGFSDPTDISISYGKKDFQYLTTYLENTFNLADNDSIRVYIASCNSNPSPSVPQTKSKSLTLIFCPVKKGIPKGYFVITSNGNTQVLNDQTWFTNYSNDLTKNITSFLDPTDLDNYTKITNPPDKKYISNTLFISYLYKNWKEYFIIEVNHQYDDNFNYIDTITASFAAYSTDGDNAIGERAYRLHIIYQFSIKGNPFSLEDASDFCCRQALYQTALKASIPLFQEKLRIEDSIILKLDTKSSEYKHLLSENKMKKNKLEGFIKYLKSLSGESLMTGGNPNGGGGDNGQTNP